MKTSTKKYRQAAADKNDDFCLADGLVDASDEEIEQIAEADAQAEISSSAYEGIPLDKARLKAGLIECYKKVRAEWPAQRGERMAGQRQTSRG